MSSPTQQETARFPRLQWWIRDRRGRVVLAQPPNAALAVWLLTTAASWTGLVDGDRQAVLTRVGQGALAVWALDEITRGASPVRRLMGALVLPVMVWRILG
jgi:GH15 family glucan-1,4-alpha-glucosidase